EDPGLRLHDLGHGPEADALAVGQATPLPPADQLRHLLDDPQELEGETALADPGHPDERDELRFALLARADEGGDERFQLAVPAHERGAPELADVRAQARPGRDRLPDGQWLDLARDADGLRLLVVDRAFRRPVGGLVDEDPVGSRPRLQPRGRVDDVA